MRALACLFLTLAVTLSCNVDAATTALDQTTLAQLVQLETRFFGHTFHDESDEERTDRLENLIFGSSNDGDLTKRVNKLAASVGPRNDAVPRSGGGSNQAGPQATSQNDQSDDSTTSNNDPPDPADDVTKESYPHITALEKQILGKSYAEEPLPSRLSRMESKAFGKASTSTDLSQRTDALEQYAEQKLHAPAFDGDRPVQSGSVQVDQQQSGTAGGTDSGSTTDYPSIDILEREILGQTYGGQPLNTRLGRMETKAFGSPSTNPDLSMRTDALEKYTEKKLHKKPLEKQEARDSGGTSRGSQIKREVLSMAASSLMGLAMGGLPVPVRVLPNFVPGAQSHSQPAEPQTPRELRQEDDAAANSPTPPVASAKLLTKISWCEMQVFGRTFPELHLTMRLGQLNRELNFRPGVSNIDLMDDMAGMIKAVQTQKQAGKPPVGQTAAKPL